MRNRRISSAAGAMVWCAGRWTLGILGVGIAGAIPARAQTLPPPQTLAHCTISPGGATLDDPASCALGSFDTAAGSLTLTPVVGLSAQAVSPAAPGSHGASATVIATYSFAVFGGNPGDTVPILIATTLNATATAPSVPAASYAFAGLTVHTGISGTATLAAVCTDGTCGTIATAFAGTVRTRARSGDASNFVQLQITAAAAGLNGLAESANATADPFILVDPSFPNANLYTIVVSPGVGNGPRCTGAIGDYVWNDLNQNGIQDAGETGINGVSVQLKDAGGNVIGTTVTGMAPGTYSNVPPGPNGPGYYQFTELCGGNYGVVVDGNSPVLSGYLPSPTLRGGNPQTDSDASPAVVTLPANNSVEVGIDFGFFIPAPVAVQCAADTGKVGVPYSSAFVGIGGVAPYTFVIAAGSLAPGLTLNPATGALSGTPTTAGRFDFRVQVSDSSGLPQGTPANACTITVLSARRPRPFL